MSSRKPHKHKGDNKNTLNTVYGPQYFSGSAVSFGSDLKGLTPEFMSKNDQDWTDFRNFSTYDFDSDRTDVKRRHEGTCEWILETREYQEWLNTGPSILYIVGDPGVGKTVLSRFLSHSLEESEGSKDKTIFFFCKRQDTPIPAALVFLSLIHQCIIRAKEIWTKHVRKPFKAKGGSLCNSRGRLKDVFESIMSDDEAGEWYCVLDALDTCDATTRDLFLEMMPRSFPEHSKTKKAKAPRLNLRFLITSRPCKQIKSVIDSCKHAVTLHFANAKDEKLNELDLVNYVDDEMGNMAGYPDDMKDSIKKTLIRDSEGMFTWASSMIDALKKTPPRGAFKILRSVPGHVHMMFQEIIANLDQSSRELLEWVAFTYRPLSLLELGAVVNFNSNKASSLSRIPVIDVEAMHSELILYGGALKVKGCHVYLVHSKLKELITSGHHKVETSLDHFEITKTCLEYLFLGSLEQSPLKGATKSDCRIEYRQLCHRFPFLEYAASYWYKHAQDSVKSAPFTPEIWKALCNSIGSESTRELTMQVHQFSKHQEYIRGQSCLHIFAHLGLTFLVRHLLDVDGVNPNPIDESGRTPLHWAVEEAHESIVELLLKERRTNPNLMEKNESMSPFLIAVKKGYTEIVKAFLRFESVRWNLSDLDGRTPLSWAAGLGNDEVVRLLLEKNAICNEIESKDNQSGQTPLLWAARKGHVNVVKLLLEENASPNVTDGSDSRSALSWAAGTGYDEVVKVLLEVESTDLMLSDKQQRTALHWAANQEHRSTAIAILGELSKRSGSNWKVHCAELLTQAGRRGQDFLLITLIDRGDVSPDSPDGNGRTALSMAAEKGHETIVQYLLDTREVNMNSKDNQAWTPLMWASYKGRREIVKMLLEQDKIDPGAKDRSRKTAAQLAGDRGYAIIADMIREKQARASRRR